MRLIALLLTVLTPVVCTCPAPIAAPRCGDGVVDASQDERCDDGNNRSGDGCRADCEGTEVCGDGLVDFGEECDLADPADPRCVGCLIQ